MDISYHYPALLKKFFQRVGGGGVICSKQCSVDTKIPKSDQYGCSSTYAPHHCCFPKFLNSNRARAASMYLIIVPAGLRVMINTTTRGFGLPPIKRTTVTGQQQQL